MEAQRPYPPKRRRRTKCHAAQTRAPAEAAIIHSSRTANAPSDESSAVEATFGPSGNFESPHEFVEDVNDFLKRSEGFADVVCTCIARYS